MNPWPEGLVANFDLVIPRIATTNLAEGGNQVSIAPVPGQPQRSFRLRPD